MQYRQLERRMRKYGDRMRARDVLLERKRAAKALKEARKNQELFREQQARKRALSRPAKPVRKHR